MRVVGLFAGVGGFEHGLALAGHEASMLCEIDPAARAVLVERFPGVQLVEDVTAIRSLPRGTEAIVAGFPCQDLSLAGTLAGISGARSGLVDVVFELLKSGPRVPWVVLENVPNLLRLEKGRGIAHIVSKLEGLGYSWAYRVVDARAFGLPQRRQRVFVVASRTGDPARVLFADDAGRVWPDDGVFDRNGDTYGFYWTEGNRGVGWAREAVPTLKGGSGVGIPSPPAVWLPRRSPLRAFVVPRIEDAEAMQGFDRGWTRVEAPGAQSRADRKRWKLVGNAVAVPVARWIGRGLSSVAPYEVRATAPLRSGRWPDAAMGGPRRGPVEVMGSAWPVAELRQSLHALVAEAPLLSPGAAVGFLDRLQRSTLTVGPNEFRRALARYCTAHGHYRIARTIEPRRDRAPRAAG